MKSKGNILGIFLLCLTIGNLLGCTLENKSKICIDEVKVVRHQLGGDTFTYYLKFDDPEWGEKFVEEGLDSVIIKEPSYDRRDSIVSFIKYEMENYRFKIGFLTTYIRAQEYFEDQSFDLNNLNVDDIILLYSNDHIKKIRNCKESFEYKFEYGKGLTGYYYVKHIYSLSSSSGYYLIRLIDLNHSDKREITLLSEDISKNNKKGNDINVDDTLFISLRPLTDNNKPAKFNEIMGDEIIKSNEIKIYDPEEELFYSESINGLIIENGN